MKTIALAATIIVFLPFAVTGQANKPIEVIRDEFKDYIKYEESTVSGDSKIAMKNAIGKLSNKLQEKDLVLLVDVWMYYDPTDFPTRSLLKPVFIANKPKSLHAVSQRFKHRRKWEAEGAAPYAELPALLKELEN
jgi:hypothetical protein